MSNKHRIVLVTSALLALGTAFLPRPSRAQTQVGHNPEHSPYRDLRATHQFTLVGGYLAGGGGRVGVGPRQGPLAGIRYALSVGAVELNLGLHAANLDRHIIDPLATPDKRAVGVASQSVMIADGGFTLRITGAKTWHGFMPYVGWSAGAASGGAVPEDASFSFSTRFQFGPHLGIRYYSRGSFGLWVEGWDPMWRLQYPLSYFSPSTGVTPVLTTGDPTKEWVHNPTLLFGFSLTFRQ